MARAKQVHVVWSKKWAGWQLKLGGKMISNKLGWWRKTDAVSAGRKKAKELKCELTIHNKNGKIQRKHSYGNDPRSIKG